MISRLTKTFLAAACIAALGSNALARDLPSQGNKRPSPVAAPTPGPGEYLTDTDNEDNAFSGNPDFDMGSYLCATDPTVPIEFNINVPVNPAGRSANLRLEVYDVDTTTEPGNPEIDKVYVNGTEVGVLNGSDGITGVNLFALAPGLLVQGKNLVQVAVDTTNGGWCVSVDWGMISLSNPNHFMIDRAWITPTHVAQNEFINIFAQTSGKPTRVTRMVYKINGVDAVELTDPDGDGLYSGQYKVTESKGNYRAISIDAFDATQRLIAAWPLMRVR